MYRITNISVIATRGGYLTSDKRESNYELLRLICIYGIITMHTFGAFIKTTTGLNMVYGNLINAIFNMGVSLFMLISGYFGIRTDWKKIIRFEITAIVYSLLNYLTVAIVTETWSPIALLKACVPVFSQWKWFLTSYMIILVFADYINLIPEKLSQKQYRYFLFLMLMVFSIIPTIIFFHPTDANSGKGFMNLFLIYLIGRYIRKYERNNLKYSTLTILLSVILAIQFALNVFISIVFFRGIGVYAIFARDCSLLIIIGSVITFLIVGKYTFYSKTVNMLAKHVFGIYLFEGSIRTIINIIFRLENFADKWYLFLVIGVYVFAVMAICIVFDILRLLLFGKAEVLVCDLIFSILKRMIAIFEKYMQVIWKNVLELFIDNG